MIIKILGSGCSNCQKLEKNAKKAVFELGLKAEIEKITDMTDIMSYGVMTMPVLVIDEKVLTAGQIPSVEEIKELLKEK